MSKHMWDKEDIKKRVCGFIDRCVDTDITFLVSERAKAITSDGKPFITHVEFNLQGSFDE